MSQGFYGFPRILDIVRATSFKALGKIGATNGAALAGGTASGAPSAPAGPFDVGDMIPDATGKLWICTTAGTDQSNPGSFTQVGGTTSPLTTKGDVWVYGSADSRLGVGSNNQVLTADSAQSLGLKWAVPAASAGGALTQLASTVLGSAAADITFSSISGAYSHLEVWILGRNDGANNEQHGYIQFNSDTGTNYEYVQIQGFPPSSANATAGQATAQAQWYFGDINGANATASKASHFIVDIPFYAATTFKKAMSSRGANRTGFNASASEQVHSGAWNSTSAITSIKIYLAGNNFVAGSSAVLYGRS